ncbi:MAG: type II secretion system protein [Clostridia bacterium]|nr:type II secretion system protein [Clostridia bacterium]
MKNKSMKEQSGITLVALVVTIVVLLILAGITIMYTMGENSIFKKAQEAKNKTEEAIKNEQEYMSQIDNMLNEYINGNTTKEETVADIVNKVQTITKIVKDENGNKVVIPRGFKIVPDTENNDIDYTYSSDKKPCVQDGIVIEDEEGNQFVWIPVGEIKNKDNTTTTITLGRYTFDTTNGIPKLEQNADNYTEIVNIKLENYSYDIQELVNGDTNTAAKNLGNFVTKTKINNGFYLARYEASKGIDKKVKSQANKEVWNHITQPDAAIAAREMYNSDYIESDLINSYSWDTTIIFIQSYSGNSNYSNKTSANNASIGYLNTGKSGDKVCNIFDIASNYYEWTTEYSTYDTKPCITRGGSAGHTYSASVRSDRILTDSVSYISFRPLLYIK